MIIDIIFDWGGVLALADNPTAAHILSKKYGYPEDKLRKTIARIEDKYSKSRQYRGFFREVIAFFPAIRPEELERGLNSAHAIQTLKMAQKLKKKYRVHLLSNQMHFRTQFIKRHNDLSFFGTVVFSSEVGMMKPEKQIYRYLLKKINRKPQQCLFIDNNSENIRAAKKLGINIILFKSEAQFKKELKKFGINIKR